MSTMFDGKSVSSVVSLVSNAQDANSRRFGLCGRYPQWMQRFATPKSFLICFCLKNIFQGMIFTYLVGSETSIERHFQFDGKSIGLLLTLGEIGPILTAVVISHWGSRGNRPRWMAIGLLLIALALLLCYPMNLVFPAPRLADYNVAGFLNGKEITASKAVCQQAPSSAQDPADGTLGRHLNASLLHPHDCTIDVVRRRWAFAACVVIYSIMGIGGTTVYCIGAPYLDDSISKRDSPFYFGITIALRIVGPVFGYVLSSFCLKLYVDPSQPPSWHSDDPRWIGAWWLGCLIMAVIIALLALVVGAFPRHLQRADRRSCQQSSDIQVAPATTVSTLDLEQPSTKELKDFRGSLRRLLGNPVLLCSCGSSTFTILGLAGYFVWLPKFYEHEFRLSKSTAAMYSGISGNVTMILGVLVSSYLMTKYRPTARKVAALVFASKYIYAFGLLALMFCTCSFSNDLPGQLEPDGRFNLDRGCNQGCQCSTSEFVPICLRGPSGQSQTFFSPCHAGCTTYTSVNNSIEYHSCKCAMDSKAEMGYCSRTCPNLYIYMVVLAIIKLIVSTSTIGNFIIDIRCVDEDLKALALGLLSAVAALLGFLPNPLIYGTLIDSSCLVWETSCSETGSCWIYDTTQFRYKLHGLTAACLMVSGIFEIITYFKVKDLNLFPNADGKQS